MNTRWQLEQIIATWLDAGGPTEDVPVLVPDDTSASDRDARLAHWPFGAVLYELWDDEGRLPAHTADRLGLPDATTYADVSRLLWSMREEAWFPARTFCEAASCLASLPPTAVRTLVETMRAYDEAEPSDREPVGANPAALPRATPAAAAHRAPRRQLVGRTASAGRVVQPAS